MHNKSSCSLGVFLSIFRFAAQPAIRNQGLPARFNRSRVAQISPLSKSKPSASQTTPILLGLLRQYLTLFILFLLLVFDSEASRRRTQHHVRTSVRPLIYSPHLLKCYSTQPCFPRYVHAISLWWVTMKSRLTLICCSPYQRYRFAAGSMLWHVWRQRRLHRRSAEIDLSQ